MLGQTFELLDLPRVVLLSFLEISLSADNAIILALLAHSLPNALRQRALLIGIVSSFLLRAAAIAAIYFVFASPWLQILGALYLIYLSASHFKSKRDKTKIPASASFWKTVLLIETFDLLFAADSIIAGIAFIGSLDKLWIVYVGGAIGILAVRYAAKYFIRLIDRFPRIGTLAYLLVGLIGIKLLFQGIRHYFNV